MNYTAFRAEAGVQTFQLPDNCFTLECCLTSHFFRFWSVKLTFIATFYGTEQDIVLTCGCLACKPVISNVSFFQRNITSNTINCQFTTDFFPSEIGIQS